MNQESMNKTTGERRDGEKKPSLRFRSSTLQHAAEAGDSSSRQAPGRRAELWLTTEGAVQSEKFLMGKSINNKVYLRGYVGSHPEHLSAVTQNKELIFTVWTLLRCRRGINLQL